MQITLNANEPLTVTERNILQVLLGRDERPGAAVDAEQPAQPTTRRKPGPKSAAEKAAEAAAAAEAEAASVPEPVATTGQPGSDAVDDASEPDDDAEEDLIGDTSGGAKDYTIQEAGEIAARVLGEGNRTAVKDALAAQSARKISDLKTQKAINAFVAALNA